MKTSISKSESVESADSRFRRIWSDSVDSIESVESANQNLSIQDSVESDLILLRLQNQDSVELLNSRFLNH